MNGIDIGCSDLDETLEKSARKSPSAFVNESKSRLVKEGRREQRKQERKKGELLPSFSSSLW